MGVLKGTEGKLFLTRRKTERKKRGQEQTDPSPSSGVNSEQGFRHFACWLLEEDDG